MKLRFQEISMSISQLLLSLFQTRTVMIRLFSWMTNKKVCLISKLQLSLFYKSLLVKPLSMPGWKLSKIMRLSNLKNKREFSSKKKKLCLYRLKDLRKLEIAKMRRLTEEIYKLELILQLLQTERNSKSQDNTPSSSWGSSRVKPFKHLQIWDAWEIEGLTLCRKTLFHSFTNRLSLTI